MPIKKKKNRKRPVVTREQLARVIFRSMRIERSEMTPGLARRAAAKIRLAR